MRPSLPLGGSVRRKNCTKSYLVSSDSEQDAENDDLNTPRRIPATRFKDECCYSEGSYLDECSSRPSISLATSVRRKVYHIDSSEESCAEDFYLDYWSKNPDFFEPDFLGDLHESPTQPCIHYKSEFEQGSNPSSNYSSIGSRRRNQILTSEEEDCVPKDSRPSIKYQSSVRRKKTSSRRIQTVIESDSESEPTQNMMDKRSSFCLGPELICESSTPKSTPDRRTAWRSFDSDLEVGEKEASFESSREWDWHSALSSSPSELGDDRVRGRDPATERSRDVNTVRDAAERYEEILRIGDKDKSPEKFGLFSEEESCLDAENSSAVQKTKSTKETPQKDISDRLAAFARQRSSLAKSWYQKFNRQVFQNKLPQQVPIKWTGRLQRTAAQTLFITNMDGSRRVMIKLSKYVLDNEFRLKKTLLHECCHVAQFLLDSCVKPPHGQVFLKWGKVATRAFPDLKVEIYHNYEIIYKHRYQCLRCFQMFGRQTRISDETRIVCSVCNGTVIFIGRGVLSNGRKDLQAKSQGPPLPQTQKTRPNPYSEFVKEKFAEYKKDVREGRTPSRRAPSIMREIAKLWKQKKSPADLIQGLENLSIHD